MTAVQLFILELYPFPTAMTGQFYTVSENETGIVGWTPEGELFYKPPMYFGNAMNLSFLIVGTSILFLCKSLRQHVARFLHLHIGDTIVGEYK